MVYLGIDGGGSKTAFLLEDENGRTIDRVESGPTNWLSTGKETAEKNIAAGIQKLKAVPEIVGAGFAGAGRPEGVRFFKDSLSALLPNAHIFVETDAFISYIGAIGLEPGVLLITGTGSIAIGRNSSGSMIRVGGWGPTFGDEGSGFWIGREALRTALRANDAGEFPEFVTSLSRELKLNSIADVNASWKSGELTVPAVASLAVTVFQKYPAEPANRILNEAAAHLCAMTETAIAKVGISNCRRAVAGSVGSQDLMKQLLRQHGNGMEFETPRQSPEHGAIIWARSVAQR